MPDLGTTYLGMPLRSPLIASAGPITQSREGFAALAEAGCGAIVMYSLFEEQLRHESTHDLLLEDEYANSFAESLSYFPTIPSTDAGLSDRYLETLRTGIEAAGGIPVIASLNGSTLGSWVEFAQQLAHAGAAALELNIYLVPGDITISGREVEDRHVEILEGVKKAVDIPVAVKLSPYFSSIGAMATRLVDAGADGLVLFNRFLQPEIDVETLQVQAQVSLSHSVEGRLPRTWIAALHGRRDGGRHRALSPRRRRRGDGHLRADPARCRLCRGTPGTAHRLARAQGVPLRCRHSRSPRRPLRRRCHRL